MKRVAQTATAVLVVMALGGCSSMTTPEFNPGDGCQKGIVCVDSSETTTFFLAGEGTTKSAKAGVEYEF